MFGTTGDANLPKWLIILVIIVGFIVGFYIVTSDGDKADPDTDTDLGSAPVTTPDAPTRIETGPNRTDEALEVISNQSLSIAGAELGMSSADFENLLEQRFSPETSEGNQTFNMRLTPQTPNGYSLIAVAENMLDDALSAQEVTAMFTPGERDAFVLSDYTVRVKCRRGSNAGNWQKQACP